MKVLFLRLITSSSLIMVSLSEFGKHSLKRTYQRKNIQYLLLRVLLEEWIILQVLLSIYLLTVFMSFATILCIMLD
ncbi:hypothetical protein HK44_029515 (plasmid) [Pseudomonas fluorescens HK44]|uniref:Uncharacterized protein n=1 Tax=Pseudomonas fluorescens HK44 TaxID=1042209 RepID=A0A010RPL7_PSEFL|nr:hypothetical protein HK44_029515 [Pseudomonas fluorescens HK44]